MVQPRPEPGAQRELAEWVRVDVTDERINFWQIRVGNRLRS
jgi:hypothetical protein